MVNKSPSILTPVDRLQRELPKQCFWDEVDQQLYIDARKLFPAVGVVTIPGWDRMMLDSGAIPKYPEFFKIMQWAKRSHFADWHKQIPVWVQDSCALFPSHQMTLLHYAGKYPQILELLDHAPVLAWRLVKSGLEEPEIMALMSGKRTQIAESIGWPGKVDTVKFLTNLRLRWVDQQIAEQIEVCLFDEQRLSALQDLPRINSMALTLAARFPELIGSKLHRALAQMPCRPMQCQSMVALLEDTYRLAAFLQLPQKQVDQVGNSRYLSEVTELYNQWLLTELKSRSNTETSELVLQSQPSFIGNLDACLMLSKLQEHAWFTDFVEGGELHLYAWQDEDGIWGALIDQQHELEGAEASKDGVLRVRGLENGLPQAKQLSTLHLWQAQRLKMTD